MSRHLDVYLLKHKVGILEQATHGQLTFCYDKKWLASKQVQPISISLPLRPQPFDDSEARPFFAGLLPDDTIRARLANILGVSETNDYGLLEELGRECAGAISLYPAGEKPPKVNGDTPPLHILSDAKLAELIRAVPNRPLLAGLSDVRLSLAGAQNKMAVCLVDGKFALPHGAEQPSTHIIKPAIPDLEHSITNEFFCMRLAQMRYGPQQVPDVEWRNVEGVSFLLIARYDRMVQRKKICRVHQEDFCQAMGIPPQHKYQRENGPSLADCFRLIDTHSTQPARDRLLLADIVMFNYLIGNADAHAKNFSFLYDKRGTRLSPFYDLLCTRAYPNLSQKMAMKIGSTYEFERVSYRHWDEMAREARLNPSYMRSRLSHYAGMLPHYSQRLMDTLAADKLYSAIYPRIHQHLLDYSDRIRRTLAAASEL